MLRPEEIANHPALRHFRKAVEEMAGTVENIEIFASESAVRYLLKNLQTQEALEAILKQSPFGSLSSSGMAGQAENRGSPPGKGTHGPGEKLSGFHAQKKPRQEAMPAPGPKQQGFTEKKGQTKGHPEAGSYTFASDSESPKEHAASEIAEGAVLIERLWEIFQSEQQDGTREISHPVREQSEQASSNVTGLRETGIRQVDTGLKLHKKTEQGKNQASALLKEFENALGHTGVHGHEAITGLDVQPGDTGKLPVQRPSETSENQPPAALIDNAAKTIAVQVERLWKKGVGTYRKTPSGLEQEREFQDGSTASRSPHTSDHEKHAFFQEIQNIVHESGMKPLVQNKKAEPVQDAGRRSIRETLAASGTPPVPDDDLLAAAVNRQLVEQARRSGVEI